MKCLLQVADTGPLESLAVMLRSVGAECYIPTDQLKKDFRNLGCDTILDIADLVRSWGYDQPFPLKEAGLKELLQDESFVYFDVKAHRNGPLIWKAYPSLKDRTCWYRINGGKPEHVVNARGDHGDEVNPPCPVLTPNLWYRLEGPWKEKAYSCWPPFYRYDEYQVERAQAKTDPLCLIHKVHGWGYQDLVPNIRALGVLCCGLGSPDGLLSHQEVKRRLQSSIAIVHLKSNDAPGYALYEALAAGCPVICSRRLIWRTQMHDLLIPGETCLVFDRETHEGLSVEDVAKCTEEIAEALGRLEDIAYNRQIGEAGRRRLKEVMWSETRPSDVNSLRAFMERFKC